jgi:putative cell wall-binding protein
VRHELFRFRRAAVALVAVMGTVGGAIAGTGGSAAAATTLAITPSTLPAYTAGNGYSATLIATESSAPTSNDTVTWSVTSGALPPGLTLNTSSTITAGTAATTTTITGTATAAATGTYTVTVSATDATTSATGSETLTISPPAVANASGGQVVLAPTGASSAVVTPGGVAVAAPNWSFTVSNAFGVGDTLSIDIGPTGTTSCVSSTDYVAFSATPTVSVVPTSGTPPVFVASRPGPQLTDGTACAGIDDQLVLTETATAVSATTTWTVTVSGIHIQAGATTPAGAIGATGSYLSGVTGATAITDSVASDATVVTPVTVTANSPAVSVARGATAQSISNIVLTESYAGALAAGTVTVTASGGTFTAVPTVTESPAAGSGGGTVGTVTIPGGVVTFTVTASTVATTYTLSGLQVTAPSTFGAVTVTVADSANSPTTVASSVTAYTVAATYKQIYGQVDIGTAVAELEAEFPYQSGVCPTSASTTTATGTTNTRPVVLATEANYPDALAADYLAQSLGTGELLTWTASLPTETLTALRLEGITNVYVVGGPLAISTAVVSQLESTPTYTCGGGSEIVNTLGGVVNLQVTQIYGQTEYDTAADIAEYMGAPVVGTASFYGAYAGTNSSSGNGVYNDTSGTASSAPSISGALPTAILATGENFPDAMSGSVLSYVKKFPLLLTTTDSLSSQAASALAALGIQQVIVMGGPLAISNDVVTAVQALGISVLRIAGTDLTDTAVQLADFEVNTTTGNLGLGWDPNGSITVARGDFYTDGLTGAIVAATGDTACTYEYTSSCTTTTTTTTAGPAKTFYPTPVLLTENPSTVGTYLTAFLNQAGLSTGIDAKTLPGARIGQLIILGGPLAVSPTTISTMQTDLAS